MIYVDDMYQYPMGQFGRMKMSHMIADTTDELHAMADKLGLKRSWFQGDHYDVSLSVRERAIEHGAQPITLRQCSAMSMYRRITRCEKLPPPEEAEEMRKALRKK